VTCQIIEVHSTDRSRQVETRSSARYVLCCQTLLLVLCCCCCCCCDLMAAQAHVVSCRHRYLLQRVGGPDSLLLLYSCRREVLTRCAAATAAAMTLLLADCRRPSRTLRNAGRQPLQQLQALRCRGLLNQDCLSRGHVQAQCHAWSTFWAWTRPKLCPINWAGSTKPTIPPCSNMLPACRLCVALNI